VKIYVWSIQIEYCMDTMPSLLLHLFFETVS
jgi:hypothetical protein